MSEPMVPAPLPIARVTRETRDVVTLAFDGGARRFRPGQFNMLYLFGVGEVAISLSGDPERPELLHTIRALGSVTRPLTALAPGGVVGVRGPFGSAWPLDEARGRDVVLVAGGLGLAPLRPAVHHLLHHRGDYGRVALVYGARTPDDLLFGEELAAWRALDSVAVLVTVDRGGPDWRGEVGVVPALLARARFDPAQTVAMVCGPEVMMRFSVRELERVGVAAERIYLSLERNMRCALGWCGHCQYGPLFVCKDGPVVRYDRIAHLLHHREV